MVDPLNSRGSSLISPTLDTADERLTSWHWMLDAIRYLVAGGISWRAMPADFPDWGRVYAFFRRWREHGLITEFHDRLRGRVREREGLDAEPTAGIIDAQSVKAAASVPSVSRGYDGGKKVGGRKRHIVTDCLGLLLVVAVTAANVRDREQIAAILIALVSVGTAPRARGAELRAGLAAVTVGNIPAGAGSRVPGRSGVRDGGEHPRGRGEQPWYTSTAWIKQGPSPLPRRAR